MKPCDGDCGVGANIFALAITGEVIANDSDRCSTFLHLKSDLEFALHERVESRKSDFLERGQTRSERKIEKIVEQPRAEPQFPPPDVYILEMRSQRNFAIQVVTGLKFA